MIAVDLAAAASHEARRLTEARALIAGSRRFVADGPVVGIAGRHRVRAALGRRILLLYRCAYEDATGRPAHSTLVAITIPLRGKGLDVRRVEWADASWLSRIDDECRVWRNAAQQTTGQFTVTRLARERAIASNHRAARPSFQPGLFDRRAHRVHIALERDAAEFSARLTARIAAVERAGVLTLRSPELLLVLIPPDAARV
jgi:hypothetical protein